MRRVCAWCNKEMAPLDGEDEESISHGICDECAERVTNPQSSTLQAFLDSLPYPVVVVDDDIVVLTANKEALAVLGKPRAEVIDKLSGTVIECAYSNHPKGCGGTEFCRGCVIRNSVTRTYNTGKPLNKIPATLTTVDGDQLIDVQHHISTEKVGELVLLRLDDLKSST